MPSHIVVTHGHIEANVPHSAVRSIFRANRQSETVKTYRVEAGGPFNRAASFIAANGVRILVAVSR